MTLLSGHKVKWFSWSLLLFYSITGIYFAITFETPIYDINPFLATLWLLWVGTSPITLLISIIHFPYENEEDKDWTEEDAV